MNNQAKKLIEQVESDISGKWISINSAELLVAKTVQECIDKIETYRIPVGNSAAGEMACEWTYDALKEIRDDIKEHFGIESWNNANKH